MNALGVLLAGGEGRRLGDRSPKALVRCGGRTLLERALTTLTALCDRVVVVAPADMALPVDAARRLADPPGHAGPLAALAVGLGSHPFDEALVLAVDFPLVSPALLAALRVRRGDAAAVLPVPGGIPQPLAAWYTARTLAPLAAALASGERSATRAALALAPTLVDDGVLATLPGGLDAWLNVNTPAELAEAERRLAPPSRESA